MRLNLTGIKENKRLQEITEIIEKAFKDTDFKIRIVPCNYEKNREKILEHHKNYYQNNKEKVKAYHVKYNNRKKAERLAKKQQSDLKEETNIENDVKPDVNTNSKLKEDVKNTKIEDPKNKLDPKLKLAAKDKTTSEQKPENKLAKKAV